MNITLFKPLRLNLSLRLPSLITSNCYCDNKSIYQIHEEGKKEKIVHGKPYPQWRKAWIEREGEWKSKLNIFVEHSPRADVLNAMQKILDLNPTMIRDWWKNMKELNIIHNQKYMSERTEILGSNLSALHFFTYRGAAVRLKNSKKWIRGNPMELDIPNKYKDGYYVEAIDCNGFTNAGIRFEGVANLMDLNYLKWLSLKNNKHIDVWCLDRIAGQNGQHLEYLDLSGTTFNLGCVFALARMTSLKLVVLDDPGEDTEMQSALATLEQHNPNLLIKIIGNNVE